ncbi:MAG: hypothetical protein ABJQ85_16460 [Rhizobiaceae bacterium]
MSLLLFILTTPASGGGSGHGNHVSKYAGDEGRAIKSLSPSDIEELRRGGGWGLARAAELNGVPGPTHLLEMAGALGLSKGQVAKIQSIFDTMNGQARAQGNVLIGLELELEELFRNGEVDARQLHQQLTAIGVARTQLRFIHLSTHLKTPKILTPQQIDRYNTLRGYKTNNDPCLNIPKGHDAEMWRKHNGCE